jgi:hypothetical protein
MDCTFEVDFLAAAEEEILDDPLASELRLTTLISPVTPAGEVLFRQEYF